MLTGYRRRQDHDDRVRNHRFLARRHTAMATLGASTALVLGAAACGGGGSTGSTSATTRAPANRAAASGGSARQVMTQLTEFKISLSQQGFTPGGYTFVVTNSGRVVHALEIDGPGVEDQKTATLQPGQSANLNVDLQKGTYQVYCPVDGHKSLGMTTNITVG